MSSGWSRCFSMITFNLNTYISNATDYEKIDIYCMNYEVSQVTVLYMTIGIQINSNHYIFCIKIVMRRIMFK